MPATTTPEGIDPVFAEVAAALYGGAVDVRELWDRVQLAKMGPDTSALHVGRAPATPEQSRKRERKLAATGLAATGVATVGGLHALYMVGRGAHAKAARVGAASTLGWAGLHGIELVGDTLGARAQVKTLQATKADQPPAADRPKGTLGKARYLKRTLLAPAAVGLGAGYVTAHPDKVAGRLRAMPGQVRQVRSDVHAASTGHSRRGGARRGGTGAVAKADTLRLGWLRPLARRNLAVKVAAGNAPLAASTARAASRGRKIVGTGTLAAVGYGTYRLGTRTRTPQRPAVAKAAGERALAWTAQIAKVDEDKRQVFGWCSLSTVDGAPYVDLQDDYVPIEETERSAYSYVLNSRKGGDMHARLGKADAGPRHTADLVESFVVTPEKLAAMDLAPDALPHGWWVGFQVNDPQQWALVKSGERTGFSIHGTGRRAPLEEVGKADRGRPGPRERVRAARHPPAVILKPVASAAVRAAGYQNPTRRLAVELNSRPERPYTYRASPAQAEQFFAAPSTGAHYSRHVRGRYPRKDRVTVPDRARLFADPPRGAGP